MASFSSSLFPFTIILDFAFPAIAAATAALAPAVTAPVTPALTTSASTVLK